jgi:hypothetical protein
MADKIGAEESLRIGMTGPEVGVEKFRRIYQEFNENLGR